MTPDDRVAEAMVKRPDVHDASTTVGQLRAFFRDDHVHMALLLEDGKLVAAVELSDLEPRLADDTPAGVLGRRPGTTIGPDASLAEAFDTMRRSGRRRLAVVDDDGVLLGLLCLKASGLGFCSDDDVADRRGSRRPR